MSTLNMNKSTREMYTKAVKNKRKVEEKKRRKDGPKAMKDLCYFDCYKPFQKNQKRNKQ